MRLIDYCWIVLLVAAPVAAVSEASAAGKDPKVRQVVARGLEWLANSQSRLGHWTADRGQYPTAMTGLAGIALMCEGIFGKRWISQRVRCPFGNFRLPFFTVL